MRITLERAGRDPDDWARELLAAEWLLTDGLGGFAMASALGCPVRRQQGWLVQSLRPPVQRVCLLSSIAERIRVGGGAWIDLAAFRFDDHLVHPRGHTHLERVERLASEEGRTRVRWTWSVGDAQILRDLSVVPDRGGLIIHYEFRGGASFELEARPLVGLRGLHDLGRERDGLAVESRDGGRVVTVSHGGRGLALTADGASFEVAPDWWRRFRLDGESARAQEAEEDRFCPGVFRWSGRGGGGLTIAARLDDGAMDHSALLDLAGAARSAPRENAGDDADGLLRAAARDFVVRRDDGLSVIAGYPWFADWGRDAMIALPGLLLETGRMDDALSVLRTFAHHEREGLLPNCFDDRTGEASYNAADASFWFLRACAEWLGRSGKGELPDDLARACASIIDWTARGTAFGIAADPEDGLITAGDESTQLTWMDAKQGDIAFTPRHGKPVELSALWAHALHALGPAMRAYDPHTAQRMSALRDKAAASFEPAFRTADGALADRLVPRRSGWERSAEVRPNMLWGAALEHAPVSMETRRSVVGLARAELLTPFGLRTLAPGSEGYRPRYEGDMWSRDSAYHNGTVWPWLIGCYVEALLRAERFSEGARREGREALRELERSLGSGCLGQVAEVYDAEPPRRAEGCPAQAWSIAELIRARALLAR